MDLQRLRIDDPHAKSRSVLFLKFYPLFLTSIVFCIGCSAIFSSSVYEIYKSPLPPPPTLKLSFNISDVSYTKEVPEICAGCQLLEGEESGVTMQVFGFPFCILFVLLLNFCSIVDHARHFSTYQKSCIRCCDPLLMLTCCFFMILTCFFMFHPILNGCSEWGSFPQDSDERHWAEADRGACRRRWNFKDGMAALFIGIISTIMYLILSIRVCCVPRLSEEEGGATGLQSQEPGGVTFYYDPYWMVLQRQREGEGQQPPQQPQQGLNPGGHPQQVQMQQPPGNSLPQGPPNYPPPPQGPPAPPSNPSVAPQ